MFTIYADNTLIYDDTSTSDSLKLVSPKLTLEQSCAGTLTMTVPPGNAGYDSLERLTTWIRVFKSTQEDPYWEGRIISEEIDFWNCKKITCEGILAVLNDTIQPPNHYQNITARSFLNSILTVHNNKVEDWKKIYVGNTDVQLTSSHRYTNYDSTLECINNKLISDDGGYIRLRYDNDLRYLDYLTTYPAENAQTIQFGRNLLDFTKNFSSEDFCTVLVPRGEKLENGPYESLDAYVDVSSVNDGSIYVTLTNDDFDDPPDTLPVDEFGWIEAIHDWDSVSVPSTLLSKAKAYLKDQQFDNMVLEVSAFDMRYAGADYTEINLNDTVRVVSSPHGLDHLFPVKKMEIPLDQPESTKFTLGETVSVSLTARNKQTTTSIKNTIAALPTEQYLTNKLKAEAAALIETATSGYFQIIYDDDGKTKEVLYTDNADYTQATNVWRWNMNGLAYSSAGYDSGNYSIAITADGKINADFISTGTLVADVIKAGVLRDQYDGQHFWFNLATGEMYLSAVEEVSDKLDNLGGRNLILDTGTDKTATSSSQSAYIGYYYFSDYGQELYTGNTDDYLTVSFDYTLSGATEYTSGTAVRIYSQINGTAGNTKYIYPESSSESGHYTATYKLNSTQSTYSSSYCIRVRLLYAADNATMTISHLKVEYGQVETDWTPAPEDSESYTDSAVSAAKAEIKITTDGISTSVSSLSNRVTTAESNITQNANSISAEVTNRNTAISEAISEAKAEIKITTDSIAASVSNVQTEVENIEVGATNMLPDSNAPSFTKVSGTADRYLSDTSNSDYASGDFISISDPPVAGIIYGYELTCTSTTSSGVRGYAWTNTETLIQLIAGETYTLSCYVKYVSGNPIFRIRYGYKKISSGSAGYSWTYFYSDSISISDSKWTQYSYTFTLPDNAYDTYCRYYPGCISVTSVGAIDICGFKLEKGNKATAWSPSPLDGDTAVANAIDTAANYTDITVTNAKAEIKLTTDAIETSVSNIQTSVTNLSNNATIYNLMPSVYYRENISGNPYTNGGITYTVNYDGSITATGTATDLSYYRITGPTLTENNPVICVDPSKTYIISGCPESGGSSTYQIRVRVTSSQYEPSTGSGELIADNGSGVTFSGKKYAYIYLFIASGVTCPSGGLTFYPMLEVGSTAHEYQSTHNGTGYLATRISSAESSITQTAESISLEVTNRTEAITALSEKVSNIGGRNLVKGTSSEKTAISSSQSAYTKVYYFSDYGQELYTGNTDDYLTVSFDYTLSGATEYTSGTAVRIYSQINGAAGNTKYIYPESSSESGHYTATYKLNSNQSTYSSSYRIRVRLLYAADNATMTISKFKVEYGQVETDWTPAPEDEVSDRDDAISTVSTTLNSLIEVNASDITSISSSVKTLEDDLESVQTDVTTLSQTATSLQININSVESTANDSSTKLSAWFKFADDGLTIRGTKDSDAGSYTKLSASRFSLFADGSERLWLTSDGANADTFNATDAVSIGDFIWETDSAGIRLRKKA